MGSRRAHRSAPAAWPWLLPAGLALLSFAMYRPALSGAFVSDDVNAIVANENVRGPLDPLDLFTSFSWFGSTRADAPGYRPLVTLSFAINHAAGGLEPRGYHAVNVALHALVCWLVYVLGLRLGLGEPGATTAALLFCVLPVHSEAVAWVVGRAELMAAAAFTAALIALLTHRRTGGAGPLALAAALLLAGLFSKENAITLLAAPAFMALLLPASPAKRRRDLLATGILLATVVAYGALRAAAGPLMPTSAGDLLDNPLASVPPPARIAGALSVFGRYLALTVWPRSLSVDYSFDALRIHPGFVGDGYTALGIASVFVLAIVAWRARRQRPAVTFAILLLAATYSIVSNTVVLIGTIMAERLFYLPSLGLCLLAGTAVTSGERVQQRVRAALVAGLAMAFALVTASRVRDWRSPTTLFEAAARAQPRSARVHMELGSAYGRLGRADEAARSLRRALEIKPDYAAAWYNLGNLYARNGRYDEAADAYVSALEHQPHLVQAWYNLGLTERGRGDLAAAAAALAEATQLAPLDPTAPAVLGDTLLAAGRNAEAVAAYSRSIERGSPEPAVFINRGVATERTRGCTFAIDDYLAAERLSPGDPTAVANAAGCLRALGRHDEAAALRARVANRATDR